MNSFCFLSAILICFKNHPGITGRKGGGQGTAGEEWATSAFLNWIEGASGTGKLKSIWNAGPGDEEEFTRNLNTLNTFKL